MTNKYWTIIPAAGIGTRMQTNCPKQYLTLQGEPLLAHVVNVFSSLLHVDKVVVVLHTTDHWWSTLPFSHPDKILTVIGGQERVHSVLLGLIFLRDYAHDQDWVIVHDAARPCVRDTEVLRLLDAIHDDPVGGLLGLPIVETLKKVDDNHAVEKTIAREHIWAAQTPQCFRYGVLKLAIEQALADHQHITDESSAIEYLGFKPKMVLGDARNIKITFPEDLALAERLIHT